MPDLARRPIPFLSALLAVLVALATPVHGQGKKRPQGQPAAKADVSAAAVAPGADSLNNLRFRNLGPSVGGGRVTAVVGISGDPNVYYVGAAAGGVWKTTDGGDSWDAVFKDQPTASIGAIALAPSNPNLVWVGTGEANLRNDMVDGRGVFFSPDAGKTWTFMGLGEVGQISRIVIDPTNPDVVFVGAVGHAWAPNAERGVYRTADGGKTWQKVLFVNDTTGVSDLVMVPGNPRVLFAGMWQVVRHPWELISGGLGSGVYRTKDGGLTWEKLKEGLPSGLMGRVALAVGPTNPNHVYALVESKQGMLWDSKDQGDHWSKVSDAHALSARPFYFSLMHVSPVDDRRVFFSSYQLLRSDDGGKTTELIDRGVHVDHHALWIDPQNPDRMIQGNDGGAYVTGNGAKSWRYLNNLPIEQFYMVAADNNIPYMLCGGLQDNNAWCGPSSKRQHHSRELEDGPDSVAPAVSRGSERDEAGEFEVPLQLDVADRRLAQRRQCRVFRRERGVQDERRRRQLDGDQPRSHAQRQGEAGDERRAGQLRHLRRRDVQHDPLDHPRAQRRQCDLGWHR